MFGTIFLFHTEQVAFQETGGAAILFNHTYMLPGEQTRFTSSIVPLGRTACASAHTHTHHIGFHPYKIVWQ